MAEVELTKEQREYDVYLADWLVRTSGSLKTVWNIKALIVNLRHPRSGQKVDKHQLVAVKAAVGLVHPATGEPLVEVVGQFSEGFNDQVIFITATGRGVEGWWEDGEWTLATAIGRASDV